MSLRPIEPKRWSRAAYERLVQTGMFAPGERAELLNGEIMTMTPQTPAHAVAVSLIAETLQSAFKTATHVRVQQPLAADAMSEPAPDVAVVAGKPRDFKAAHPTTALLAVEVADTTLTHDREKAGVYAKAGVAEYWVVNLVDRGLEVYREPAPSAGAKFGAAYRRIELLGPTGFVTPVGAPGQQVGVAELLP